MFENTYFMDTSAAWNFIKKENLAQVFFCELWETFKNTYFIEHLRVTAPDTCFPGYLADLSQN